MIVSSIVNHNGAALTFGLITAVAVLCLMVATAVSSTTPSEASAPSSSGGEALEATAADVEERVQHLLAAGVDEGRLRDAIRLAVRLGREQAETARRAGQRTGR
jgi:hypothetical protein